MNTNARRADSSPTNNDIEQMFRDAIRNDRRFDALILSIKYHGRPVDLTPAERAAVDLLVDLARESL